MKSKIIFAFISFMLLFGINNSLLYNDLEKQVSTAKVINLAGRQRMYSQKITKLALYLNEEKEDNYSTLRLEGLKEIITNFSEAHQFLEESHLKQYKSLLLNQYFKDIEHSYLKIINSSREYLNSPNDSQVKANFIKNIKFNESEFLRIMDDIVNEYEKIAETRAIKIKGREFTFNAIMVLLTIFSIFSIIIPLLKNKNLNLK
ncbi:Type IV pili methyl-accepting chemotaxis transducer N-term [Polaribacter sp. KT25b]|uniref:type IV pili methyl-accepting chemotaxis transducer N-terminal domain-containing protein n=1 Tax=Polaribacter sp. KT25b TaxID=1855336 RepID=UPI00087A4199|nr:type IV pili methyl-accepting chemotaxis transducer N-terminal domain-containing protein [Polaribacter sp. KT25b]SDS36554.1 Type IV pili methyl-accepting chemotaxis transducer N-term [Polaribacter sp. KT25b]